MKMQKFISFDRLSTSGNISFKKGYGFFGKVPIADIICKPMVSLEELQSVIKTLDMFLYCCEEITFIYFFYKKGDEVRTVRYSCYMGTTEIEDMEVTEETITACDRGTIHVFIPEQCNRYDGSVLREIVAENLSIPVS